MRRRDKMSGLWSGSVVCILKNVFERLTVDVETFLFRIPLSHVSFLQKKKKKVFFRKNFFSFFRFAPSIFILRGTCLAVRIDFQSQTIQ